MSAPRTRKVRLWINEQVREILLSDLMIEEMKKHRLSVRKLAKCAKVSATTIQSIRDGEAQNIGMKKLEHILSFVGRKIDFPPMDKQRAKGHAARACP